MLAHAARFRFMTTSTSGRINAVGAEQKNQRGRQQTGPGGASLNLHVVRRSLVSVGAAFGGGEHFLHRDRPMLLLLHVSIRDVLLGLTLSRFSQERRDSSPGARGDGAHCSVAAS